jgi:hypothetical protein
VKKLVLILVFGTVGIITLFGILAWMSWQPLSWYSIPDYTNPETVQLADRAEYRLNEEFHKIRATDDVWRLRIPDEALNAWLSGRLDKWLTHDTEFEIPEEIQGLQVHSTPDGLWVAAMVEIDDSDPRPVAVKLSVLVEDGKGSFKTLAIRFGQIPVPVLILNEVIQEMPDGVTDFEARVPLTDDREVEIKEIDFEDGAVVLTCQTHLPQ